jgi:hypothetical protein
MMPAYIHHTNARCDLAKKLLSLALASALTLGAAGCGRHENQPKAADTGSSANSAAAAETGTAPSKGPLQTGEVGPANTQGLPSGTEAGSRTTPNTK